MPKRTRVLLMITTLVLAGLVQPAGTAHAATTTTLAVRLTCDVESNVVEVRAFGKFSGRIKYLNVRFRTSDVRFVTADGPDFGSREDVTVRAATQVSGHWSVGRAKSWAGQDHLFYTETVQVDVSRPDGVLLKTATESCIHDTRTTVHFECGPGTSGTVSASAVGYPTTGTVHVRYFERWRRVGPFITWTSGLGDPVPVRTATIQPAPNGTWSDPGMTGIDGGHYVVEVWQAGSLVGKGEKICDSPR